MTPFTLTIINIVSFLVLLAMIFAVFYFLVLITPLRREGAGRWLSNLIGGHATILSFLIALGAMLGSLFFSNVADFTPCLLCWWQRIFLYPQVAILFIALLARDKLVRFYSVVLSGIGFLIAAYHTFITFGGTNIVPCSATGPSCETIYFLRYGFVTIPTMSLTIFALILLFMLTPRPKQS